MVQVMTNRTVDEPVFGDIARRRKEGVVITQHSTIPPILAGYLFLDILLTIKMAFLMLRRGEVSPFRG